MPKYNTTIWVTTTTRHTVEVEADDWEAAEDAARLIYEEADTSAWECVGQDLEIDVDEDDDQPSGHVDETEIIDRMREARFYDDQPPRD